MADTHNLSLRLDPNLADRMQKRADSNFRSLSGEISFACQFYEMFCHYNGMPRNKTNKAQIRKMLKALLDE